MGCGDGGPRVLTQSLPRGMWVLCIETLLLGPAHMWTQRSPQVARGHEMCSRGSPHLCPPDCHLAKVQAIPTFRWTKTRARSG